MLNGSNFKYYFWADRFHMIPHYYKQIHGLFLNNFLQLWLIGKQIYQVPPFIYINQDDEVYYLARGSKVLWDIKYSMSSVKLSMKEVGIWTEENWGTKRVNSLYTMVSGRLNFKINKRFGSLSWSSVVRSFIQGVDILLDN